MFYYLHTETGGDLYVQNRVEQPHSETRLNALVAVIPKEQVHCKNATLNIRDITIYSVVRVGNYLDQKKTMTCTNTYTLKQIDTF